MQLQANIEQVFPVAQPSNKKNDRGGPKLPLIFLTSPLNRIKELKRHKETSLRPINRHG